jgi:5-methylcytosine-specific restriction protein A
MRSLSGVMVLRSEEGAMPNKPLKPCKYPGCPELVPSGYCAAHASTKAYDRDPEKQRLYGRAWQKRRIAHLAEHPWCEDCLGNGIYTEATDVHHVIPHRGDKRIFWSSPLQSLCHACHSSRTASEGRGGSKVQAVRDVERRVLPRELISQCGESS